MNILLITIDSLRFDHLGCYGYGRDTSPNIDKLAKKGVLFTQAIANGGNTPFSFPSMLASALPPLDAEEGKTIMRRHTILAELLRKAGYRTGAFHSSPYLSKLFGYDKGFDAFEENLNATSLENIRQWLISNPPPKPIYNFLAKLDKYLESFLFATQNRPIVSAQWISGQAVGWMKGQKGNFFLWVHYMDVHCPYMPMTKYIKQFHGRDVSRFEMSRLWRKMLSRPPKLSSDEIEMMKDLYDAEIRYVDDAVGWLLGKLGSRLKNTVVVVTADHGEEFGEHGVFSHQSLYEGIVRVPLVIAGAGIKGRVGEQVGLIDLAPTIAELAGLGKIKSFHGGSLLPLAGRKKKTAKGVASVWCNPQPPQRLISYRTPPWKYIRTESMDGGVLSEEAYDLRSDSKELVNLLKLPRKVLGERLYKSVERFRKEAIAAIEGLKKDKARELTELERARVKEKVRKLRGVGK